MTLPKLSHSLRESIPFIGLSSQKRSQTSISKQVLQTDEQQIELTFYCYYYHGLLTRSNSLYLIISSITEIFRICHDSLTFFLMFPHHHNLHTNQLIITIFTLWHHSNEWNFEKKTYKQNKLETSVLLQFRMKRIQMNASHI